MAKQSSPPRPGDGICFSTRGVTKVYGSGPAAVHALRGVDIDLPEGEMVVVLGASGSGKSTFLNIIGGLDTATEGEVVHPGQNIADGTGVRQRRIDD